MDINDMYAALDMDKIDQFIRDQQEENLFLEFKTINSPDMKNKDDRANFAKALSGFANSAGGVIVWGVDARQKQGNQVDCACDKKEIEDVPLFLSKLNDFTGSFVTPIVEGVQHKAIVSNSNRKGLAVTLVPASDRGPHMAKGGEGRYYKRSGGSFYPMEHFDLADMFGRRRHPVLEMGYRIETFENSKVSRLVFTVANVGRGIARYPYVAIRVLNPLYPTYSDPNLSSPNDYPGMGLPKLLHVGSPGWRVYGGGADIVIHPNITIDVTPTLVFVPLTLQNIPSIKFKYQIGAEDIQMTEGEIEIAGEVIKTALIPGYANK
ncbi:MAG: hypothetical protein NVSMB27_41180 [Ktedonobacteraceae bacterium]